MNTAILVIGADFAVSVIVEQYLSARLQFQPMAETKKDGDPMGRLAERRYCNMDQVLAGVPTAYRKFARGRV